MIYAVCAAALMIIRCPGSTFLRCSDDSFYVGSARDLEYRLQQHAIGCVDAYTETRRPVSLAWAQECEPRRGRLCPRTQNQGLAARKEDCTDRGTIRRSATALACWFAQACRGEHPNLRRLLYALRQAQGTWRWLRPQAGCPSTGSGRIARLRAHSEAQGACGFRWRRAGYLPSAGLPEDGEKCRARGPGI